MKLRYQVTAPLTHMIFVHFAALQLVLLCFWSIVASFALVFSSTRGYSGLPLIPLGKALRKLASTYLPVHQFTGFAKVVSTALLTMLLLVACQVVLCSEYWTYKHLLLLRLQGRSD